MPNFVLFIVRPISITEHYCVPGTILDGGDVVVNKKCSLLLSFYRRTMRPIKPFIFSQPNNSSPGFGFASRKTLGNIWRQFWLACLGVVTVIQQIEPWDAAKHPTASQACIQNPNLHTAKKYSVQNFNNAEVEKLWLAFFFMISVNI